MRRRLALVTALTALSLTAASRPDGNRLAYLDGNDPYYVGLDFPKLITPQWVGEDGVEAVVVLAIDDMRDPAGYETFLRPILNRLKAIDDRAPVSIMTCVVKPDDPRLQGWLKEGLSFEVHTLAHPCPLLQKGDLAAAKATVDGCIDLLNQGPGNRPVAFRMPCCDSKNTLSPRFFCEIFNKTTPAGHFLTIDSSVFQLFTPADPSLPRSLVEDPDGGERFRKYLPFPSFVNTIENYPYPYVIGGRCWEFPCMVPSDWEANNLHKPNNPRTVEDLKAALDAVVLKKGVFNLVFHPHGWIKSEQVVELIDHAVKTHGKKVKFLNFREAEQRINTNLLGGVSLRDAKGRENGVRILDLDNDGYMDVVIGNHKTRLTRVWNPTNGRWKSFPTLVRLAKLPKRVWDENGPLDQFFMPKESGVHFGITRADGRATMMVLDDRAKTVCDFGNDGWVERADMLPPRWHEQCRGVALRDLDGDGRCELIHAERVPFGPVINEVYRWSDETSTWDKLPFGLPENSVLLGTKGGNVGLGPTTYSHTDSGLRFVDLDGDGHDDVIVSNEEGYGVYLFDSMTTGWARKVRSGKPGDPGAIPKIVREPRNVAEMTNNGLWVHSRHLWWQNEDTATLPDLVARVTFNELLKDVPPRGKSAEAARQAIRVRPGFRVELAASEPLVLDPIAFDWSADGKLWVVEMGDYPLGVDGKGKPGGQVRILEDTDNDGRYDKVSIFLDNLGFPTGVMPWRNGVLVACAPEIFYAEDRDGDGKADVREVLFTGFHPGNQQHRVNGFEMGLDGWVYGANGDSGGVVRSLKTGKTVDIHGRDFRFRPDTGEFEAETGATQYGRHRDDWGRWFGNNNPTWAWQVVLADSDLRRNPSFAPPDPRKTLEPDTRLYPVSPTATRFNDPGAANHVTSANSPTPYRDDLFGPHFESSLFVSEPVHNLVHRMILEPDGPTLRGHRAPGEIDHEFLASSDPWFRPTMLKTGPDGALWVADMDRAVIEHPEWIPDDIEKTMDLRAGSDRGRLFRVVPVAQKPRPIPRLDRLDTAGLVAALDSPSGWQRDTAHRLLLHKNDPAAVEPLTRLALTTKHPKTRVQALWALQNLGALYAAPVLAGLNDPDPQVRRNAVRLVSRMAARLGVQDAEESKALTALGDTIIRRADDPDASVRLEVVLYLAAGEGTGFGSLLGKIALREASDPWFHTAVMTSAPKNAGLLLAELLKAPNGPPENLTKPLFALLGSQPDNPEALRLIQAIATPAGPDQRFASWQFLAMSGLLDAKAGRGGIPAGTVARLADAARDTAMNSNATEADRVAAVSLLGREPQQSDRERSLLIALLTPRIPVGVQLAALTAVSRGHDPKLPEPLLAGWKGYSPSVRAAVLDALLSRPDWSGALLSSLEDKCTPAGEIDPAHRRQLLTHAEPRLRARAAAVFGPEGGSRQEVVETYRKALKPGDPAAGAGVFKRVCAACHKLGGVGNEIGPDLAALNDRSSEALLIAILDPSRAFEAKYAEYTVHLLDGRVRTGMIASETATALTLRRQQGEQDVILRSEIEALAATGKSLMPDGVEKDVSPRDFADLIAYLTAVAPRPGAGK